MRTDEFDFDLPEALIAQAPIEPRDAARLLVLHRETGNVTHHTVADLPKLLDPGDLLLLNNTRVMPYRLFGLKPSGGKAEILLLKREGSLSWQALVGGRGLTPGIQISDIGGRSELSALIIDDLGGAKRLVQFSLPINRFLEQVGRVPLPPYIKNDDVKLERYQTIYAEHPGSAAAPTAGLHFTPELLEALESRNIGHDFVTLHVGLDTFLPIAEDNIDEHTIHTEVCQLDRKVAKRINTVIERGRRVVAVGTTSTRTIETAANAWHIDKHVGTMPLRRPEHYVQPVASFTGPTSLYITPGYRFRTVNTMLTNFHTPRSTNLVMVSAFCEPNGREKLLNAYHQAIAEKYRFFSFGDAMLIL